MKIYAFADEASPGIDGQIEAMIQNQIQGIEIRMIDGRQISDLSLEEVTKIKEKMDKAGLKTWSVGSPIGKIEIEKADMHREKFKHVLKIAEILGAKNIRLFSYYLPKGADYDLYTGEVITRLKELVELAKSTGITLCHENEKGIFGDVPERCVKIHKAIPEIKAIFDPANYIQCGVDTLTAWEMIKPYVKYLHIKDAYENGYVVPAGKGIGNIPFILNDYMQNGGEEVTVEPHLTVFNGFAQLEMDTNKNTVDDVHKYPSNAIAFKAAIDALRAIL